MPTTTARFSGDQLTALGAAWAPIAASREDGELQDAERDALRAACLAACPRRTCPAYLLDAWVQRQFEEAERVAQIKRYVINKPQKVALRAAFDKGTHHGQTHRAELAALAAEVSKLGNKQMDEPYVRGFLKDLEKAAKKAEEEESDTPPELSVAEKTDAAAAKVQGEPRPPPAARFLHISARGGALSQRLEWLGTPTDRGGRMAACADFEDELAACDVAVAAFLQAQDAEEADAPPSAPVARVCRLLKQATSLRALLTLHAASVGVSHSAVTGLQLRLVVVLRGAKALKERLPALDTAGGGAGSQQQSRKRRRATQPPAPAQVTSFCSKAWAALVAKATKLAEWANCSVVMFVRKPKETKGKIFGRLHEHNLNAKEVGHIETAIEQALGWAHKRVKLSEVAAAAAAAGAGAAAQGAAAAAGGT